MKKNFTCALLALLTTLFFNPAFGQASCPEIIASSYRLTPDPLIACKKTVAVDFVNPTGGAKSIGIKVTCDGIVVLNECHDASGQKDVRRSLVSASFICCNLPKLVVEIAAYTGNSTCLGTPCVLTFSIAGAPLPVDFNSFSAIRNGKNVQLEWTTASEQNNAGFAIERKNGSGNWQQIATVSSAASGGNSSAILFYNYTDVNDVTIIATYRIKQTDLDGKSKYSDVRAVTGNTNNTSRRIAVIYPNPGKSGEVKIIFKGNREQYDVTLIDASGRTLKNWRSNTGDNISITDVVPGLYNVRMTERQSGKIFTEKIVIK